MAEEEEKNEKKFSPLLRQRAGHKERQTDRKGERKKETSAPHQGEKEKEEKKEHTHTHAPYLIKNAMQKKTQKKTRREETRPAHDHRNMRSPSPSSCMHVVRPPKLDALSLYANQPTSSQARSEGVHVGILLLNEISRHTYTYIAIFCCCISLTEEYMCPDVQVTQFFLSSFLSKKSPSTTRLSSIFFLCSRSTQGGTKDRNSSLTTPLFSLLFSSLLCPTEIQKQKEKNRVERQEKKKSKCNAKWCPS
mmetsp:Transcript_14591/g.29356  ORF Transcript_14591/g.29356 Transcript_14591/m.29356 type:complete len:249 (+) Transcript_14591:578-1324(+)